MIIPKAEGLRTGGFSRGGLLASAWRMFDNIKALNPLVAMDSRLIDDDNAGRPLSGGDMVTFDGSTQYVTADVTSFDPSSGITLKATFKPDLISNDFIVAAGDKSTGAKYLGVRTQGDGDLSVQLRFAGAGTLTFTGSPYLIGAWQEVEFYASENLRYIIQDGVETFRDETFLSFEGVMYDRLAVGVTPDSSPALFFVGSVANASFAGGVTATYPLGETTGTTALDSSGNGNHGTYGNAPTFAVDNTVPFSAWNQLGGSERMLFDGSGRVVLDSSVNITGEFDISFTMTTDSIGVIQLLLDGGTDSFIRINSNGTSISIKSETSGTSVTLGTGGITFVENGAFLMRFVRDGANLVTMYIDGDAKVDTETLVGDLVLDSIAASSAGSSPLIGLIYNVNINDQASYLGTGNTDADWLDQIGSNDGTVTGGSTIRIPRNESNTALDVLGNAVQWQGSAFPVRPVERQSSALSFDGVTQYGITPDTSGFTEFTFCGWIKTAYAGASEDTIIGASDVSNEFMLSLNIANKVIQAGVGETFTTSATVVNSNTWRFVALSITATTHQIIVDGVSVASGVHTWDMSYNLPLNLAARNNVGNDVRYLNCSILDARIFDQALSVSELSDIMTNRSTSISGTRYPLAEGAGSTAYNTDGTNHATLVGNPTWVREDGIPSSNLDDGFSKRMYFNGDKIALTSEILLTGSFSISCDITLSQIATGDCVCSDLSGGSFIRINANGNTLSIRDESNTVASFSLDSTPFPVNKLVNVKFIRDGSNLVTLYINDVAQADTETLAGDIQISQFGLRGVSSDPLMGTIYNVNINDQASYLGTGNTDADWLDQIGSNDGTVTGGETLRIPAAEGSNSLDALGDTLTNKAVVDGHNDAETELDFYNLAADGGTTPEILASGVAITDYTFGDSVTNPIFKRSVPSVTENRHILFPAILSGSDLEAAIKYTL